MTDSVAEADTAVGNIASARPFSTFERLVAWRYLRARRKESVVSVIAAFSFIGIMLGVAALIVVMAVMNGFRSELITRILGINGHMIVQMIDGPMKGYADMADRFAKVPGVKFAIPFVDGQVLAQGKGGNNSGALVRGIRADDLAKLKLVSDNIREGDLVGFASGDGILIGSRLALLRQQSDPALVMAVDHTLPDSAGNDVVAGDIALRTVVEQETIAAVDRLRRHDIAVEHQLGVLDRHLETVAGGGGFRIDRLEGQFVDALVIGIDGALLGAGRGMGHSRRQKSQTRRSQQSRQ